MWEVEDFSPSPSLSAPGWRHRKLDDWLFRARKKGEQSRVKSTPTPVCFARHLSPDRRGRGNAGRVLGSLPLPF